MSLVSVQRLESLWRKALAHGSQPVFWEDRDENGFPRLRREIEWDISMKCEVPVTRELYSRWSEKFADRKRSIPPARVILTVRCRKCGWCRNMRRRFWAGRAVSEIGYAPRTWFSMFSFAPEAYLRGDARAIVRLAKAGVDFRALPPEEQFAERVKELGKEFTLFAKRMRKPRKRKVKKGEPDPEAPEIFPFRYLLIAEEGDEFGRVHFHALIHEESPLHPIRKDVLEEKWWAGYSYHRLVTDKHKGANYCTKYLAKDMRVKVRASEHYGQGPKLVLEHSGLSPSPFAKKVRVPSETSPSPLLSSQAEGVGAESGETEGSPGGRGVLPTPGFGGAAPAAPLVGGMEKGLNCANRRKE